MEKKKPAGILVMGFFEILIGIIAAYSLVQIFNDKRFFPPGDNPGVMVPPFLILLIFYIPIGIGMLRLKRWALIPSKVLLIICLIFAVCPFIVFLILSIVDIKMTMQRPQNILAILFFASITFFMQFMINYLNKPEVKALFAPERREAKPKGIA